MHTVDRLLENHALSAKRKTSVNDMRFNKTHTFKPVIRGKPKYLTNPARSSNRNTAAYNTPSTIAPRSDRSWKAVSTDPKNNDYLDPAGKQGKTKSMSTLTPPKVGFKLPPKDEKAAPGIQTYRERQVKKETGAKSSMPKVEEAKTRKLLYKMHSPVK